MTTIPPKEPVTICDVCDKQDTNKYSFLYQRCYKCLIVMDVCLDCAAKTPLLCKTCKGGNV